MPSRHPAKVLSRAPLLTFAVTFGLSCWVGAALLLVGPNWIRETYVYLSGADISVIGSAALVKLFVLLNACPLILLAGWMLAGRCAWRSGPATASPYAAWRLDATVGSLIALGVYVVAKLGAAGAFAGLSGVLGYTDYIAARMKLIDRLPFFSFVAIYTLIPLLCGAAFAELISRSLTWVRTILPIAVGLAGFAAVNLLLDQKRPLLTGLILIALVVVLDPRCRARLARAPGGPLRLAAGFGLGAYAIYLVLLVIPILSSASAGSAATSTIAYTDFALGAQGWSTTGRFIRSGATLTLGPGRTGQGLIVTTRSVDEGTAYALGSLPARGRILSLTVSLRSPTVGSVTVTIGQAGDATSTIVSPGTTWRRYTVSWRPRGAVVDPGITFALHSAGAFAVDDMQLVAGPAAPGARAAHGPPGLCRACGHRASGAAPVAMSRAGFVFASLLSSPEVRFPTFASVRPQSHDTTVFLLALFGPVMRTAGPAVAYPIIFPGKVPYYPVDLGLDTIRIGRAPDDNITSFRVLFPSAPPGSNAVPFMFALYSQGGIVVALLGSLIIGLGWRAAWETATRVRRGTTATLAQALVVLFGLEIAQDAARNSVLSSYGVGWPLLVVIAVGLLTHRRVALA